VIERQRQLHLGMLVRAMVMAAGTPGGAYQADILRSSLACAGPWLARAAVSRWFDEPLERFMAAVAERALLYARAPRVDLTGILGGVQDWSSVDATTVHVRDALRDEAPGRVMMRPSRSIRCSSSAVGRPCTIISARLGHMTAGI
jgi:hypothetical protein